MTTIQAIPSDCWITLRFDDSNTLHPAGSTPGLENHSQDKKAPPIPEFNGSCLVFMPCILTNVALLHLQKKQVSHAAVRGTTLGLFRRENFNTIGIRSVYTRYNVAGPAFCRCIPSGSSVLLHCGRGTLSAIRTRITNASPRNPIDRLLNTCLILVSRYRHVKPSLLDHVAYSGLRGGRNDCGAHPAVVRHVRTVVATNRHSNTVNGTKSPRRLCLSSTCLCRNLRFV